MMAIVLMEKGISLVNSFEYPIRLSLGDWGFHTFYMPILLFIEKSKRVKKLSM